MEDPETDPKGEHKANLKNSEIETNVTLLPHRTGILLFICIVVIISLFLLLLFYQYFLFLFFLFSFLHLISV